MVAPHNWDMETATTIQEPQLRHVLGRFVTGVGVVTCATSAGPVGMTVNSFTSVSLDPPLVLFCAQRTSRTGAAVLEVGTFAVTILGRHHRHLADRFARGPGDRFAGLATRPGPTGSPILLAGIAFVDCRVVDEALRGDHTLVIGEVVQADVLSDAEPLTFFRGRYLP